MKAFITMVAPLETNVWPSKSKDNKLFLKDLHVVTRLLLNDWVSVTRLTKKIDHHFQVLFPMSNNRVCSNINIEQKLMGVICIGFSTENQVEPSVLINRGQLHESVFSIELFQRHRVHDAQQTKPRSFRTIDSKVNVGNHITPPDNHIYRSKIDMFKTP